MIDRRLWELRNLEIHRRRLSHPAYFLLASLTDHLYNSRDLDPEDFPLATNKAGEWLRITNRRTIKSYLDELIKAGILIHLGYTDRTPWTCRFRMPLDLLVPEPKPVPQRKGAIPRKHR